MKYVFSAVVAFIFLHPAHAKANDPPVGAAHYLPALVDVSQNFRCPNSAMEGNISYKSKEKPDNEGYEYLVNGMTFGGTSLKSQEIAVINSDLAGKSITSVLIECQQEDARVVLFTWHVREGVKGTFAILVSKSGKITLSNE